MTLKVSWCDKNKKNKDHCRSKIFSPFCQLPKPYPQIRRECPLNISYWKKVSKTALYPIHHIEQEAKFWCGIYRTVEEDRLNEISFGDERKRLYKIYTDKEKNPDDISYIYESKVKDTFYYEKKARIYGGKYWITDLLKRIWAGERCYFYAYILPKVFPSYETCLTDQTEKNKYLITRKNRKKNQEIDFEKRLTKKIKDDIAEHYGTFRSKKFNPLIRAVGLWIVVNDIKNNTDDELLLSKILKKEGEEELEMIFGDSLFSQIRRGTKECIRKRRLYPVPSRSKITA